MSPDDTVAVLRLLEVLEECRQIDPAEAEAWRRRITGWARFNAVGAETVWSKNSTDDQSGVILPPA